MLEFFYELTHVPKDRASTEGKIESNTEAHFEIRSDGHVIYADEYFNIVEFATQLHWWLMSTAGSRQDFNLMSIDDSEEGMGRVFFKNVNDKWLIGSVFLNNEPNELFSLEEIGIAADVLKKRLVSDLSSRFDVNIGHLIETFCKRAWEERTSEGSVLH